MFLGYASMTMFAMRRAAGPAGLEVSVHTLVATAASFVSVAWFAWGFIAHRWWLPPAGMIATVVAWNATPRSLRSSRWLPTLELVNGLLGFLHLIHLLVAQ